MSVHFCGVYEAVADMCDELAPRISDCSASTGGDLLLKKMRDQPTDWSRPNENSQIFQIFH